MSTTTGILAISGSLRSASHNTALLRAAAALSPSGVEVTRFDGLAKLPPYSEELDGRLVDPGTRGQLAEIIRLLAADARRGPAGLAA